MVICPGGGYGGLAGHEGKGYADWLVKQGVDCFVLKYRLGSAGPARSCGRMYRVPFDSPRKGEDEAGSGQNWGHGFIGGRAFDFHDCGAF